VKLESKCSVAVSMELVTLGVNIVINSREILVVVYFSCAKGQNIAQGFHHDVKV